MCVHRVVAVMMKIIIYMCLHFDNNCIIFRYHAVAFHSGSSQFVNIAESMHKYWFIMLTYSYNYSHQVINLTLEYILLVHVNVASRWCTISYTIIRAFHVPKRLIYHGDMCKVSTACILLNKLHGSLPPYL